MFVIASEAKQSRKNTKHRSGLLCRYAPRNDEKKYPVRDRIFIEISLQAKAACGAAAVFHVICSNPHVMHKEISFLPSDAFLMECE
jgi:hypothetical protein